MNQCAQNTLGFVAWTARYDDLDRGRAEVVFARNKMEARRLGSEELETDWECVEVERSPEFDSCSSYQELREAQLAQGWWFSCGWCDCGNDVTVTEDDYDGDEACCAEPFVDGADVYCNEWHAGAEAVRHVERRIRIWEALEATLAKFPGVTILHVWPDAWRYDSTSRRGLVDFRLPNDPTFRLSWEVGSTELHLPGAFLPAFREYQAQTGKGQ